MVDVNLANYKGILYPLDLNRGNLAHNSGAAVNACLAEPAGEVKPLVDLCAEKTVMDATTTARALNVVPRELYFSLMRAALVKARDRSIEVLISKWPWAVLSLQKLAPSMFNSLSTLYSAVHVTERMRRGVKYTTCLAHTFVECLKKRTPTKLKCLDLTGYPAAEVIVNYLSSHVLLVYNEARQKEIICLYNKVTHDWPNEQRHNYNLDTTLPDDIFLICIDAFVQTNDTHMELCRALKTSKSVACRFRLRVSKLDLTCLGAARTSVLLEQIDPLVDPPMPIVVGGPELVVDIPATDVSTALSTDVATLPTVVPTLTTAMQTVSTPHTNTMGLPANANTTMSHSSSSNSSLNMFAGATFYGNVTFQFANQPTVRNPEPMALPNNISEALGDVSRQQLLSWLGIEME